MPSKAKLASTLDSRSPLNHVRWPPDCGHSGFLGTDNFNCGYLTNPSARQATKYDCLVLLYSFIFFALTELKNNQM